MKSTKKLIIAAFMLVFAFVAAVSSTFAWFTLQNEVDVDEISVEVGAAGNDLQIAGLDGSFSYSYALTQPTGVTLLPVTWDNTATPSFQKLSLNAGGGTPYFEYASASGASLGYADSTYTWNGTGDYLTYDLQFRSNTTALEVYLDLAANPFTLNETDPLKAAQNAEVLKTIRIMFVDLDSEGDEVPASRVIYSPYYNVLSDFGNGDYFLKDSGWIAEGAFWANPTTPLLSETVNAGADETPGTADDYYEVNTTNVKSYPTYIPFAGELSTVISTTRVDETKGLKVTTLETKAVAESVRVYIWIEGWDGNATNESALSAFDTRLLFKGYPGA
ncbi:MAG: hypothetical protein PHP41_03750 [Bacilli bacterium]|nr:hypothetical protein [Bacilli bacterium]